MLKPPRLLARGIECLVSPWDIPPSRWHDIYDSDNGWGMGLGAKDQNDADVCALAEILKEEDDDEDEESEEK